MKKTIYGTMLVFVMASCSTVTPALTEYTLNPVYKVSQSDATSCKSNSLKIAKAFSPKSLESQDMNYLEGLNKQYSFTQSIWTEPLNKTITQEIVKSLRESRIFKSVQLYKSRSKSDYLLETNIENFVQHFSKDEKTSYVEVRLTFSLLNLKDNSLVESKTFTTEVESKTLDAEGGVEALSTALSKILSQNTFWLTGVCK